MTYRYYIVNLEDASCVGTDDEGRANYYSECGEYVVIDTTEDSVIVDCEVSYTVDPAP